MTWKEGGTYHWEINNVYNNNNWDTIGVTNTLNIAATSGNAFRISINSFDYRATPERLRISTPISTGEFLAVPEPSTYALMALGICAIVFVRRRKVS